MEKNSIYNLKLHELIIIDEEFSVRRVPGGWIYYELDIHNIKYTVLHTTFVPYNNEFQDTPRSPKV